MHSLADALHECSHTAAQLERALDGAMSLIGGDLGNIQICNAADGALRIAAHEGFGSEFLEYFAPHREVAAAARFRAVQRHPRAV
jgi:hypothetical protein